MNQLPLELYWEIVSHIPDRQDLKSVSLTSLSLHCEAEPFIWRTVTIHNDRVIERLTYLSTTLRIARYIHSLKIVIKDSFTVELFRTTLRATSNLKSLEVYGNPIDAVTLGYLAQGTTFMLRRLLSYIPISLACREFFQRQTQLADLELSSNPPCPPTEFLSPTDLSSLTTLRAIHNREDFNGVLLLGRRITHLKCRELTFTLAEPLQTLVVIDIGYSVTFNSSVWELFPNLRSICFRYKGTLYVVEIVKNLPHLRYARMFYGGGIEDYSSSALFAKELYECNARLEGVEITYRKRGSSPRWRFERNCAVNIPPPQPLDQPGIDDWMHW